MKNNIMYYLTGFTTVVLFIVPPFFTTAKDPMPEAERYQVTHVYEDGCLDVYDVKADDYRFMCEEESFYNEY